MELILKIPITCITCIFGRKQCRVMERKLLPLRRQSIPDRSKCEKNCSFGFGRGTIDLNVVKFAVTKIQKKPRQTQGCSAPVEKKNNATEIVMWRCVACGLIDIRKKARKQSGKKHNAFRWRLWRYTEVIASMIILKICWFQDPWRR